MSTTAVPLRPVSKGGLYALWIGLFVIVAGAVAWALFVSAMPTITLSTEQTGSGRTPTEADFVVINYEGRLADGTVFDSNQGVPFPAAEGGLIPGFTMALRQMQVGGKYKLHIPAELGYGATEQGPIPANSDLDFDVEVVAIRTREEMQQMMMQQQMMQQLQGQGGEGGPPAGGEGGPPSGP